MECWCEKCGDKQVFCYRLDDYWYKQHSDKWIFCYNLDKEKQMIGEKNGYE